MARAERGEGRAIRSDADGRGSVGLGLAARGAKDSCVWSMEADFTYVSILRITVSIIWDLPLVPAILQAHLQKPTSVRVAQSLGALMLVTIRRRAREICQSLKAFSRAGHLANQWGLTFLVCG